jgi:hypothetical protein
LDPLIELPPEIDCNEMDKKWKIFDAGTPLQDIMELPELDAKIDAYFSAHSLFKISSSSKTTTATASTATSSSTGDTTSESSAEQTESSSPMPAPTETDPALDDPGQEESKGSKKGMAIGLGAGIPLAIALIGTVLFFFLRGRRRLNDSAQPDEQPEMEEAQSPQDPVGSRAEYYSNEAGLPAERSSVHELPSLSIPSELEGSSIYDAYGSSADDGQGSSHYGGRSTLHSRINSPLGSEYSGAMYAQGAASPMSGICEEGRSGRNRHEESYDDEKAEEAVESPSSALPREGSGRTVYEMGS